MYLGLTGPLYFVHCYCGTRDFIGKGNDGNRLGLPFHWITCLNWVGASYYLSFSWSFLSTGRSHCILAMWAKAPSGLLACCYHSKHPILNLRRVVRTNTKFCVWNRKNLPVDWVWLAGEQLSRIWSCGRLQSMSAVCPCSEGQQYLACVLTYNLY